MPKTKTKTKPKAKKTRAKPKAKKTMSAAQLRARRMGGATTRERGQLLLQKLGAQGWAHQEAAARACGTYSSTISELAQREGWETMRMGKYRFVHALDALLHYGRRYCEVLGCEQNFRDLKISLPSTIPWLDQEDEELL